MKAGARNPRNPSRNAAAEKWISFTRIPIRFCWPPVGMRAFRATASMCSITTSALAIQARHVSLVVTGTAVLAGVAGVEEGAEDAVAVAAVEVVVEAVVEAAVGVVVEDVGVDLSGQRQWAKVWTE